MNNIKPFLLLNSLLFISILSAQYNLNDRSEFPINRNNTGDILDDMFTGDFNNDGNMDIVIDGGMELNQSGYIEFNSKPLFYLGDGNGNLVQAATTFTHPGNSSFICDIADYSNDGFLDLLVADFWANGMRLYNGAAGVNFTLAQNLPTGTHGAKGQFQDMDADGDLDVVNVSSGSAAVVAFHFFENNVGTFTRFSYNSVNVPEVSQGEQPDHSFNPVMLATDLNHDGRKDVCSLSYNKIMNTWIQNEDKSFTAWGEKPVEGMVDIANERISYWLQDMNNDGFEDLMYLHENYPSANVAVAYTETNTPYFGDNVDLQGSVIPDFIGNFLQAIVRGDIDNDGQEDIIAYDRSSNKLFITMDPFNFNNSFNIQKLDMSGLDIKKYGHGLILADLDNDHLPELVSVGLDDVLRVFHNSLFSIQDSTGEADFIIYPNPAKNVLTIKGIEKSLIANVNIYNSAGALIRKLTGEPQIALGGIPTGTYVINIQTKDGRSLSKSFIKK